MGTWQILHQCFWLIRLLPPTMVSGRSLKILQSPLNRVWRTRVRAGQQAKELEDETRGKNSKQDKFVGKASAV